MTTFLRTASGFVSAGGPDSGRECFCTAPELAGLLVVRTVFFLRTIFAYLRNIFAYPLQLLCFLPYRPFRYAVQRPYVAKAHNSGPVCRLDGLPVRFCHVAVLWLKPLKKPPEGGICDGNKNRPEAACYQLLNSCSILDGIGTPGSTFSLFSLSTIDSFSAPLAAW